MEKKWWKESVVYQIYPRSFKDSNGTASAISTGLRKKWTICGSWGST